MLRSCRYAPLVLVTIISLNMHRVAPGEMPWVRVANDKQGFVLSDFGQAVRAVGIQLRPR